MSATEHLSRTAHPTPASRTPRVTVAQLFLMAVRRWQRNRALNDLRRLDDRQLDDIGISRNDIPRVVEGLFPSHRVPLGDAASAKSNGGIDGYDHEDDRRDRTVRADDRRLRDALIARPPMAAGAEKRQRAAR